MPFIELIEHVTSSQARPRRFYVNIDRITYVAALTEDDHAAIIFDERTLTIVVDETFGEVIALIDQESNPDGRT
jgi:hypothetical protein